MRTKPRCWPTLVLILMGFHPGEVQAQPGSPASLTDRVDEFLATVDTGQISGLIEFFPKRRHLTYQRTIYREGTRLHQISRIPADRIADGLSAELWESFQIQWEGQPIGLFAEQLLRRGNLWQAVSPTRYVPPGGSSGSGIFLEWLCEDGVWVIVILGDEYYESGPVPAHLDVWPSDEDALDVEPRTKGVSPWSGDKIPCGCTREIGKVH